jgi:hypothetical protein
MKRRLEVVIRESDEKERIFMTNIEISRSAKVQTFSNSDRLGKKRLKEIGKDGKRIVKRVKKIEIATPCAISIGPRMLLVKTTRKIPNWPEIEKKIVSILRESLRKKIDDVQVLREDLSFKKVH